MHMLSCASIYVRGRELQIGGRFTDRVYANNNAAARSVGIHAPSRVRKGYRRTRIGAVKARTSRLGRSLNDSPDNGDECGHNSPRLRNVQRVRATLLPIYWPPRHPFYLLFFPVCEKMFANASRKLFSPLPRNLEERK